MFNIQLVGLEGGPGPLYVAYGFVFLVVSLFVDLQINQVTLQLGISLSDLV
jgi:drug/metabolite transporter superfamily protein YnfA